MGIRASLLSIISSRHYRTWKLLGVCGLACQWMCLCVVLMHRYRQRQRHRVPFGLAAKVWLVSVALILMELSWHVAPKLQLQAQTQTLTSQCSAAIVVGVSIAQVYRKASLE